MLLDNNRLEGEDGDCVNGPVALKLKKKFEHEEMMAEKLSEDHLARLQSKAHDQSVVLLVSCRLTRTLGAKCGSSKPPTNKPR